MSEETEGTLPEPIDLMSIDIDELGAMANEVGPTDDDEPVAEEAIEPSDDEEVEPQEADVEPEEAEEEAESAEVPVDDVELLRAQLALNEAALGEERARREHYESLAGRHGGALGHLKQELEQVRAKLQNRTPEDEYVEQPQPRDSRSFDDAPVQQPNNKVLVDLVIDQSVRQWQSAHADAFVKDEAGNVTLDPEIASAVAEGVKAPVMVEAYASGDPIRAREAIVALLEVSRNGVAKRRAQARIEEVTKRRADQSSNLKEKKRVAASAKAGTARAAPRRKPVDLNSMPLEELAKLANSRGA